MCKVTKKESQFSVQSSSYFNRDCSRSCASRLPEGRHEAVVCKPRNIKKRCIPCYCCSYTPSAPPPHSALGRLLRILSPKDQIGFIQLRNEIQSPTTSNSMTSTPSLDFVAQAPPLGREISGRIFGEGRRRSPSFFQGSATNSARILGYII